MLISNKYIFFLGDNSDDVIVPEESIEGKVQKNEDEVREIIEAGVHLSDNPNEVKYLKMLAKRLL